jgi:glycosyltransferase involved in cell wall biosynthesis
LKLALVTRRYPPLIGGAEKVLSYLAGALAVEGAEVIVVTSRMPGLELAEREEIPIEAPRSASSKEQDPRGRLTIVRLATSRLRFWGTWRYMQGLQRWFRANPVDLAYVSMLKHDAYVAIGAGRRLGFPVVLRPEGAGATGDIAWQSWGNFGRRIGRRCRFADAFVVISEAIETELRHAWSTGTLRESPLEGMVRRAPKSPWIVSISNGVPVPAKPWQQRPEWRAAPRAVFLGRLAPEKGLETLIDAWPSVRAVHPEARLILIGEGPLRSALEDRARALGLTRGPEESVELPGPTLDATAALRDADLFVLPSREEGMSMALLEAMALGMPLVASAIAGNRRLIGDFQQGRLTPPDDSQALARVIGEQWADFDRAVHMGRAARCRIEQEFSIEMVARKHLDLFHELVRGR